MIAASPIAAFGGHVGCSSDPSATTYPAYEGGAPDADPLAACQSCIDQACVGPRATCAGDATCITTATCSPKRVAVQACAVDNASACGCGAGSTCALDAGVSDAAADAAVVTSKTCSDCVAARCGDPKKPCGVGTECDRYLGCAYACKDAACVTDCGSRYATGQSAAADLAGCTVAACSAACGL